MASSEDIRRQLTERLFKSNIVQNNFRGEVLEEIVNSVIGNKHGGTWEHSSADWNAWDFRCDDYFLQVKQAAARQSWDTEDRASEKGRGIFHIRPNSGYYGLDEWHTLEPPQRIAQIYVFGWHACKTAHCDQFDGNQWKFFVTRSEDFPEQKLTININELKEEVEKGKAACCSIGGLNKAVNQVKIARPSSSKIEWRSKLMASIAIEPSTITPLSPTATS